MKKLMMFMKRKQGISFEKFRAHYENVHIPMVAAWVGHLMVESRRYYPTDAINLYVGRADEQEAPVPDGGIDYDAVSIYTVRDDAALLELMRIAQNPELARITTEDEAIFADRALSRMTFTEEFVLPGMS